MPQLATTSPIKALVYRDNAARYGRLTLRLLGSFWSWWRGELLGLFENPAGQWLLGPRRRTLYLRKIGIYEVELRLDDGAHAEIRERISSYSADVLNSFLSTAGLSRRDVDLVVSLPADRFFARTLRLPEQTVSDLDNIIAKDLARKTTFKPEDILDGYEVEREPASDKLTVQHWVIRRSFVVEALADLHIQSAEVSRIEGYGAASPPRLHLNRGAAGASPWYWTGVRLLALASVILAVLAFGLASWRKQGTLAELSAKIDASRAKAQSIRTQMDDLDKRQSAVLRVRSDKISRPGASEIWEKVTAALPVQSWLTELQLTQPDANGRDEQTLRLTGFSISAAELVTLFENAGGFADASLTSPVSLDPTEKHERFALQMRVKSHASDKAGRS